MHTLERFADELLGVLAARPLVHAPCLVQRGPDRHPGVQRRVGVLEDHLHPAPELAQLTARGGAHVEAIELDPPGVWVRSAAPGSARAWSCRCPTLPPGLGSRRGAE